VRENAHENEHARERLRVRARARARARDNKREKSQARARARQIDTLRVTTVFFKLTGESESKTDRHLEGDYGLLVYAKVGPIRNRSEGSTCRRVPSRRRKLLHLPPIGSSMGRSMDHHIRIWDPLFESSKGEIVDEQV